MSVNAEEQGGPIAPGSPLARALGGYGVPELSAGFAERVLAAADARRGEPLAPLPELRRPPRSRRWRIGQRIAIGAASFGALATAAAATGLLEQLAIPGPAASAVWASLTGSAPASGAPAPAARPAVAAAPAAEETPAAVAIVGPVDTPEELGEAFRRVDQVRAGRREERRALIDRRIAGEIERRRAAGLRVPTPEEEARLRARIAEQLARREAQSDAAVKARREAMQRKVEAGEPLTREDILGPRLSPQTRERLRQLRQLPREQRREAWRSLPPEERRAMIEEVRARRGSPQTPAPTEPEPEPAPPTPEAAPPE